VYYLFGGKMLRMIKVVYFEFWSLYKFYSTIYFVHVKMRV